MTEARSSPPRFDPASSAACRDRAQRCSLSRRHTRDSLFTFGFTLNFSLNFTLDFRVFDFQVPDRPQNYPPLPPQIFVGAVAVVRSVVAVLAHYFLSTQHSVRLVSARRYRHGK